MQYRPYGSTGRDVSMLGFGAMRLPQNEDGTCDYDASVPLLRQGIDAGINYIDTARGYISGTSEVAVGKAIKGYDRRKLFIVTKIPSNDIKNSVGREWRRQLEEQLRRFDMEYIDLILFHGLNWASFEEHVSKPGYALEAARKAQADGLVRHVGFSSHDTADGIVKLIATGEFEGILVQYNFLDDHNRPAIDAAHDAGLGVTIMGPVAGGRLGVPGSVALPGQGIEALRLPDLALRYVWSTPGVSVALSGMNAAEQIEENVASAERTAVMTAAEQSQIAAILEKNRRLTELYCTACGYCMPCPNDVNIPENFRYMNWHRVWGLTAEAKDAYAKFSEEGFHASWSPQKITGLNAEYCIQCGICEPKCPQNIPIRKQMKEVAAALGA
ncbi:MAG: aldo/keto reductase [Spirochaetaceae bacterium]|nr:MAG: aldo/keto reductase [Spirochaetaceae bacterium]